jgi:tetratricopeptide (TPR) repeat protein
VLSLVGLTARLLHTHESQDLGELVGAEALGVARWHQAAERHDQAESAYRAALESHNEDVRLEALRRLSLYLKRQDRRQEAVPVWEAWHQSDPEDIRPCIELAMVYEWHEVNLDKAMQWAQEAMVCLSHWPAGWRRDRAWDAVQHRVERLKGKLDDG